MTVSRVSSISPASSARLAVSSGLSGIRALSGYRAKSAPARRRALWLAAAGVWASAGRQLRAAAVAVCALLLLGVSVPAYGQGGAAPAPGGGLPAAPAHARIADLLPDRWMLARQGIIGTSADGHLRL
jgi:hypothetical protein